MPLLGQGLRPRVAPQPPYSVRRHWRCFKECARDRELTPCRRTSIVNMTENTNPNIRFQCTFALDMRRTDCERDRLHTAKIHNPACMRSTMVLSEERRTTCNKRGRFFYNVTEHATPEMNRTKGSLLFVFLNRFATEMCTRWPQLVVTSRCMVNSLGANVLICGHRNRLRRSTDTRFVDDDHARS